MKESEQISYTIQEGLVAGEKLLAEGEIKASVEMLLTSAIYQVARQIALLREAQQANTLGYGDDAVKGAS